MLLKGGYVLTGMLLVARMQIKNLSKGSRCYFPVFVKGANLSVGDLHFSQGDVRVFFD